MKQNRRNNKPSQKKKHKNYQFGCVIAIILMIPICYGVYLYCQQTTFFANIQKQENKDFFQIPPSKDLEIPTLLTPKEEQIVRHAGYTVAYNKNHKIPNWVSYELTRQETQGKEKRNNRFIADPLVKGPIATNTDYARSGYDKGHMAPAADMKWSSTAMKESFYFSNICPQHPQLNRRSWKNLEEKIRDWAIADSAIIIICGTIIDKHPKTIGKNRVTVPKQFFKVVLSPFVNPIRAIGFLFNNEQSTEPISSYAVSVDSIESLTGLDFFTPLPDEIENSIESKAYFNEWPR